MSPIAESDSQPEDENTVFSRRGYGMSPGSGCAVGAGLVLLGILFLLQNFGLFTLDNWWALFLLIPAFGALRTGWEHFQNSGYRLTHAARGPLFGGIVMLGVAIVSLLGLDFSLIWPFALILGGVALLVGYFLPD